MECAYAIVLHGCSEHGSALQRDWCCRDVPKINGIAEGVLSTAVGLENVGIAGKLVRHVRDVPNELGYCNILIVQFRAQAANNRRDGCTAVGD